MSQRPGNKKSSNRRNRKTSGTAKRTTSTANQQNQIQAGTTPSESRTASRASARRESVRQDSRAASRREAAQAQAQKKKQLQMIIAAVAAAAVIALAFILINRPSNDGVGIDYTDVTTEQPQIIAAAGTPEAARETTSLDWATGYTVGDPSAPVTMHIYSDFQCHFCKSFHDDTLPKIMDDYVRDGKVKLVFHDFPRLGSDQEISTANQPNFVPELTDPANESSLASQAAMCAGEQDQYLQMTDKLFGNYKGVQAGAYERSNLERYADDLGLNMDDFNACLDSGRYIPALADSVTQGQAQGVTATPMFVLDNGSGQVNVIQQTAEGYDLMKKQIDVAIQTAP